MRIFIAIRHSLDPKKFYGSLWSTNFYPALLKLGHELIESRVDLFPASRFMHIAGNFTREKLECRSKITQAIIDEIEQEHKKKPVDLVLSYFYNSHFDPAGFSRIRALGIKTCNFYCNSIYQFELVAQIAKAADFSWYPEKNAEAFYLKAGANPICVQMAADPTLYHPDGPKQIIPKACFVGQRYADRSEWIAALMANNIPIDVYGSGWGVGSQSGPSLESPPLDKDGSYLGRKTVCAGSLVAYLSEIQKNIVSSGVFGGIARSAGQFSRRQASHKLRDEFTSVSKGNLAQNKICETYSKYGAVLNFSNVWADGRPGSALIPHVRLRDFEAPMCGAFYLTGYTDEIAECFKIDTEIVTYKSSEELVDKVTFYLKNSEHARRIASAGHLRATRDHTWVNRFESLFNKLN